MRITIDVTEAEGRSTTVSREIPERQTIGQAVPQEPVAADGGPPPEALLLALGSKPEVQPKTTAGGSATDAGSPASWLLEALIAERQSQ